VHAGVVLAGGRSSRMGAPKALLEWHGSTLLRRVVGIVQRAVTGPVIVVASAGQPLPALPPEVVLEEDPEPARGPVLALATGLTRAAASDASAAFVCATDLPFLHPAFVTTVLRALDESDADVALPELAGHPQPLAAAYRTAVALALDDMARERQWRLRALFDRCRALPLTAPTLLADPWLAVHDPKLASVVNLNTLDDYLAARSLPPPAVSVLAAGSRTRVRAATVGAAAAAAGLPVPPGRDPEEPLAAGDELDLDGSC
jgi:molybdopterin-guanine dinucleotide biosynthesis protein A